MAHHHARNPTMHTPPPSTASLVRFLGIGRIARTPSGEIKEGEHLLVAYATAPNRFPDEYTQNAISVMDRATKLEFGKRLPLLSADYAFHVLPLMLDDEKTEVCLFAAVDFRFNRANTLLSELGDAFTENCPSSSVRGATKERALQKNMSPSFDRMLLKWEDKLLKSLALIDEVKTIAASNIDLALENLAAVADLEHESEILQEQANKFVKAAGDIEGEQRRRTCKLRLLIVLLVVVILTVIIVPIVIGTT